MYRETNSSSVCGQEFFVPLIQHHQNTVIAMLMSVRPPTLCARPVETGFDLTAANHCCDENSNQGYQLDANLHVIDIGTIVTCRHLGDPYQ
jgi:hypothetical protein